MTKELPYERWIERSKKLPAIIQGRAPNGRPRFWCAAGDGVIGRVVCSGATPKEAYRKAVEALCDIQREQQGCTWERLRAPTWTGLS